MSQPPELTAALDLLRGRLSVASRSAVPCPPASQLLQRHGLEAGIEQRFCGEMFATVVAGRLDRVAAPRSMLVVDVSRTGRAAALWVGNLLELFAAQGRRAGPHVTLALPGTRWAGRGKLLDRHLRERSRRTGMPVELVCGPASVETSAPEGDDERAVLEAGFDLILVLGLAGSGGLDAPWPEHPARGWLEPAHGAVLTFIDAEFVMDDLSRYANLAPPRPLRLRVERLDDDEPDPLGEVDLGDLETARRTFPPLVEEAKSHPWRVVISPPAERHGTRLACYSDESARRLLEPLEVRRTLVAGRLRLVTS